MYWNLGDASTLTSDSIVDAQLNRLRVIFASVHYSVGLACMRTFCNAWNTAARFHSGAKPCCFCGLPGGDSLEHIAACDTIMEQFANISEDVLILNENNALAYFLGMPPFLEDAHFVVHGIVVAASLSAHQMLAGQFNGRLQAKATLAACLRALARKDLRCRRLLFEHAMTPEHVAAVVVVD
jgi:hypothetical protein